MTSPEPIDRGEQVSLMEPMRLPETSRHRGNLADLAVELASRASGFRRGLPPGTVETLADLVRSMNCYYSNLIEGHDTHPVDIERALSGDYSDSPLQRNLQLEARAHVSVQRWIDAGGLTGRSLTGEGAREVHRRFGELLPADLMLVDDLETGETAVVTPGVYRTRDVQVGRHVAVSPGAIPRFMARLEQAYTTLGTAESVIAAAAAHHRLLWIHPFLDGNGRVARLLSHALLLDVLDTAGVWSVARGLARNSVTYKEHLSNCDMPRRGDMDGRGHLSEEALADFTRFFLETCLDQVAFMEGLIQPQRLRERVLLWAEEESRASSLPRQAARLLEALLHRGEIPRAEVPGLLGTGDRQARRIVSALAKIDVVTSETSRAPLRLAFPARLAHRWLPGLFPEQP